MRVAAVAGDVVVHKLVEGVSVTLESAILPAPDNGLAIWDSRWFLRAGGD